jgi:hypothetical protein
MLKKLALKGPSTPKQNYEIKTTRKIYLSIDIHEIGGMQ